MSMSLKMSNNKEQRPYWTDEAINFMIASIHKTPYMWDKTHKDFSMRYLKHNFWKNLKWTLEKRFQFRVYTNELARKWLNLSSYYRLQMKAIFDANARGASQEDIKRLEGWKFLQQMKFLPSAACDKTAGDAENLYDSAHSEYSDNNSFAVEERKPSTHNAAFSNPLDILPDGDNNVSAKAAIEEFNVPMANQDDEIEDAAPMTVEPMMDDINSTPSFHYGMAIAQDVFELDDNLKIDAKMEIMQVIVNYQKKQLHRTVMNLAGS